MIRFVVADYARDLLVNGVLNSRIIPRHLRWGALRLAGYSVARSVIAPGLNVGGRRLSVGAGTFINYDALLDTSAQITIGRRVRLGMRVTLVTASHDVGPSDQRGGRANKAPILIGDGCWLGAGVTVLPGVTVGDGTIIAAGAVVTRDCDANSLYAGVPARKVRDL